MFGLKLHKKYSVLIRYIYVNFAITILDTYAIIIHQQLFFNTINIITLILYIFSLIYCLSIYLKKFTIINQTIFLNYRRVIYLLMILSIIIAKNLINIVVFKFILSIENYFPIGKLYLY